ncbi:pyocin knob domain-containing protein [Paenibacillus arenosi]|uniref:Phage tail protein n=1 Tax=Paenibacillus arenosi TaxID=2774142 RepID=A0ABR9AW57_9BACL|nr:pyocin knob domain-containing protein [Paenibacillus arenosi]MBD8498362.1 hypothetical protein [Paenibacillus arenosi]
MAYEKQLPEWKAKGIKPPQSKLDEGWKVQDKPPAAWLNWQMNSTYEVLQELQQKSAEKTDVTIAEKRAKEYVDQKVAGIDLNSITPASIGAETPAGAQSKANQAETNAKNASLSKSTINAQLILGINNVNNLTTTGFYDGHGLANAPSEDWYYYEVINHSNDLGANWVTQIAHNFNSNFVFKRTKSNGQWSSWTRMLDTNGGDLSGALHTKGQIWAGKQTQFGNGSNLTLAIGDSDTGFKWNGEGNFDIVANDAAVANVTNNQITLNTPLIVQGVNINQIVRVNNGILEYFDGSGWREVGGRKMTTIHGEAFLASGVTTYKTLLDVKGSGTFNWAWYHHPGGGNFPNSNSSIEIMIDGRTDVGMKEVWSSYNNLLVSGGGGLHLFPFSSSLVIRGVHSRAEERLYGTLYYGYSLHV